MPGVAEFDQLLFRGREQDGTYALRPAVRMHIDRVELTGSRVRVAGSRAEDGESHNLIGALDDEVMRPLLGFKDVSAPGGGCASDVETVKVLIGHDAAVSGPPGRNVDLGQPCGVVHGRGPDADVRSGHGPESINCGHRGRAARTRRRAK